MWNQYSVMATTSCIGTQLSLKEMTLGLDRHDLVSDGKLHKAELQRSHIAKYHSTTLGKILSSDKFIKFDMLARNVLEEGFDMKTPCEVGSAGKYQELKIRAKKDNQAYGRSSGLYRFVQVGTSYHGDLGE